MGETQLVRRAWRFWRGSCLSHTPHLHRHTCGMPWFRTTSYSTMHHNSFICYLEHLVIFLRS